MTATIITPGLPLPGPGGAGISYRDIVMADGPVLYLPFGSAGLLDVSGRGNHAVATGSPPTATFDPDGSGAMSFNGLNQWLTVANPSNNELSIKKTGRLTIEAWISPSVLTPPDVEPNIKGPGDYCYWLGKGDLYPTKTVEYAGRQYQEFPVAEPERGGRLSIYIFNLSGDLGTGSQVQMPIVVDEWIHLVGVCDMLHSSALYPTGYVAMYRNGVLVDKDPLNRYNVVPAFGGGPLRIGTAYANTLAETSYFKGRIGHVAIYPRELTAGQVSNHYHAAVDGTGSPGGGGTDPAPSPGGGGTGTFVRHIASSQVKISGTRLQVVVPAGGVPAGHTLLARSTSDYTATGPTMFDSKGNTWTRDRTAPNGTNTFRASLFSCQVHTALTEGDIIEMRTSSAVTTRAFAVDQFSGLAFSAVLGSNGATSTSATPGTGDPLTVSNPNYLIHAQVSVAGPTADSVAADLNAAVKPLTRVGTNTGSGDLTLNGSYASYGAAGTRSWTPTLGPSRNWIHQIAAYAAGTATPSPPPAGTAALVQHLGAATSTTAGTTLAFTIPADGQAVPAGRTLLMSVNSDYTVAGPSAADSKGNTWTRNATAPVATNVGRTSVFSCPVTTALLPGDTITVTFPVSVTRKALSVAEFSGLTTTIDQQNSAAATSGSPNHAISATHANAVVYAVTGLNGPGNAAYIPDVAWKPLAISGTTGSGTNDRTVLPQYRVIGAIGSYTHNPQLSSLDYDWAELVVVYEAA